MDHVSGKKFVQAYNVEPGREIDRVSGTRRAFFSPFASLYVFLGDAVLAKVICGRLSPTRLPYTIASSIAPIHF